MGQLTVCSPVAPPRVHAWILWEEADPVAWTKRAVPVRFGLAPHQPEVWVWAGTVERI